jgi:hypothetical protein
MSNITMNQEQSVNGISDHPRELGPKGIVMENYF